MVDQFVHDLNGNRKQQILDWVSGTSETASQDVTTYSESSFLDTFHL